MEWCTRSENGLHAFKMGLCKIGDKHKEILRKNCRETGKRNAKPVRQYDLQGNFIKQWESMHEAEKELNVFHANIVQCCKGKYKKTGGYIWRYAE